MILATLRVKTVFVWLEIFWQKAVTRKRTFPIFCWSGPGSCFVMGARSSFLMFVGPRPGFLVLVGMGTVPGMVPGMRAFSGLLGRWTMLARVFGSWSTFVPVGVMLVWARSPAVFVRPGPARGADCRCWSSDMLCKAFWCSWPDGFMCVSWFLPGKRPLFIWREMFSFVAIDCWMIWFAATVDRQRGVHSATWWLEWFWVISHCSVLIFD